MAKEQKKRATRPSFPQSTSRPPIEASEAQEHQEHQTEQDERITKLEDQVAALWELIQQENNSKAAVQLDPPGGRQPETGRPWPVAARIEAMKAERQKEDDDADSNNQAQQGQS